VKRAILMLCLMAGSANAARDDEAIGPVYPIAEESAETAIVRLLKEREAKGELRKLEQAAISRSLNSAKNPKSVQNIGRAKQIARFTIDATLTYPRDVIDPTGQVIAKAGTTVNPLTIQPLTQRLVFFDGNDKAQVSAVKTMIERSTKAVRPILIAGSWYALAKRWKQTVYFDQQGLLSSRFGVTEVPAIVEQVGEQLVLTQMPASELNK
jgi:conjugal transfer pilus assembly protein TraW